MTRVKLFGLDDEVEFDENNLRPLKINNGDFYEEAVITTDGTLIGFDEAICDWVRIGHEDDIGYEWI